MRVALAARGYLGTPWRHQARLKGVGIDCVGVLVCAAREAGFEVRDVSNYPRAPADNWLVDELRAQLLQIEIGDVRVGDVLAFQWRGEPWHVGLISVADPLTMVHAWRQVERCEETRLDEHWRRRIAHAWRFKEAA